MNQKDNHVFLSSRGLLIALGTAALLMILGSFLDYPISMALYNESNPFGMFLAAYGEYPAMLGFLAAGVLLIAGRNQSKKLMGVLQCIGGGLLAVLGTLGAAVLPTNYLPWPKGVIAVIGLICCAAVIVCMVKIAKNAPRETVICVAATLFFVAFAEMLLINIVKIPWGRARMRLVANDPRAYFMPWWQTGSALKDTLVAAGVAAEEFKSFPSGHTGNAAVLILLGLLPQLDSRLEKKKPLLQGIGFGWTALVAFSRIIMGAHYLTDTTIGFTITLLVSCLVTKLVYRQKTE